MRGAIVPFRLSQGALSAGYDSPDYYFYVTFGTMPTLYAGIHLLSHDKPSYVFYSRSRTFDPAEFPGRAEVTIAADRTADATQAEMEGMAREMKRRILEINSADPTAVFGLYVDDLRCRIGYDWFVAQGIDSARVKVSMLSDGTGTYNNFYNYFGDAATAEQNWDTYAAEVEALDWNHGGRYPETRSLPEFESYTWPYYLSTRPDYRLVVQDGSLLESSCPFITEKLGEMEIESIQPYEMLSALPESARKRFYDMADSITTNSRPCSTLPRKRTWSSSVPATGARRAHGNSATMSHGSWSSTARGMTSSSSPTPPIPRRPVTRPSSRG